MTAAIYMEVVDEIDRLQTDRAAMATRWAAARRALDAAQMDNTPPSRRMDMQAALEQLSNERNLIDHKLIVAVNKRKAMDRDRAAMVRSGLMDRYARQVREIGITLATLVELDARRGHAIPDCPALGRTFLPAYGNQPGSSTGGALEVLDVQGLAIHARKEADLLLARQDADVVEAHEPTTA